MFIHVKLFSGFPHPLWYQLPSSWTQTDLVGSIVKVPFRMHTKLGLVVKVCDQFDEPPTFNIKEVLSVETMPQDQHYWNFITKLSDYYQIEPLQLVKRLQNVLKTRADDSVVPPEPEVNANHQTIMLTNEQQVVCDYLNPHIIDGTYAPTVLHGVTGSGKTEIYKRLIMSACAQGKQVVLLLPEVSLALNFQRILSAQLPNEIPALGFHSAVGVKEKKLLWDLLLNNMPVVIVGVHLPVLLPIPNLGLIIIDEEHDVGFQEKKHPKINSKEAAMWRAHIHQIPIVLGSATPSLSSLALVEKKQWKLFNVTKRFAGAFPQVKTVYLNDKKQRRNFWISTELECAIKDRLEKKEQIILFLNRRGFIFFLQCKPCGAIFECPSCSVSLTLHTGDFLHCHYCGHTMPLPDCCAACGAPEKDFLKKGIGTQQITTIVQKVFPEARIARADLDSTINKKTWQQTVQDFSDHKLDMLIGTQTITKGYHFPRVTLVGILWADINLHFPNYHASEVSLQQLIQVAGRAGRYSMHSDVIIQTLTEHPIFDYINEIDYPKFYDYEMGNRQLVGYPPYKRLAEIELKHENEDIVEKDAQRLAQTLREYGKNNNYAAIVLGPAKPPVHKIKNTFNRTIILKGDGMHKLIQLFKKHETCALKSSVYFVPNPLH